MLVPDRRRRVLEAVRQHGSARVIELADELGVSAWTIRRDLADLERLGQLRRARGGAIVEPVRTGPRGRTNVDDSRHGAKDRIGREAAARIAEHSTVLLLAGSTTGALVPYLSARSLTVITNGLDIAGALQHSSSVSLVVLGGVLHREQMTLLGPLTEQSMQDLHVDLIVAGAWGIDPEVGVTGSKVIAAGQHHGMLRHSDGLMVVADSTKFGRRGPTLLAGTDAVDMVVTDDDAPGEMVSALRERGPDVVLC